MKKGDQQALEELFEKYYYQLCDFAFRYVRSVHLAEEVVELDRKSRQQQVDQEWLDSIKMVPKRALSLTIIGSNTSKK